VRTAVVVPGHRGRERCLDLVREGERAVAETPVEVVVFSGGSRRGALSEAEEMRAAWRGPDVELLVEPTASVTAENASRTLPLLLERGIERALVVCAPLHLYRTRFFFTRLYGAHGVETEFRVAPVTPSMRALLWELGAATACRRQLRAARAELAHMAPS
jgi:uncharacterized SAM-binding protein YcdF (DUF218 family)